MSHLATTLGAVKTASPATKVLMLSSHIRRETIAGALATGADGFLAKDASSRQVASAIRTLVRDVLVKLGCTPSGSDRLCVRTGPGAAPYRPAGDDW
jgi:DNA-binding response OmpR family regulator